MIRRACYIIGKGTISALVEGVDVRLQKPRQRQTCASTNTHLLWLRSHRTPLRLWGSPIMYTPVSNPVRTFGVRYFGFVRREKTRKCLRKRGRLVRKRDYVKSGTWCRWLLVVAWARTVVCLFLAHPLSIHLQQIESLEQSSALDAFPTHFC